MLLFSSRKIALSVAVAASLFFKQTTSSGPCFYGEGSDASGTAGYKQCPGTNFCCVQTEFCQSNGLCRDINNNANGSLTYFPGKSDPGPYNYTGLYRAPTCTDKSWTGCVSQCDASLVQAGTAKETSYIWACNKDLTEYCCHNDGVNLGNGDCCGSGTRFKLPAPIATSVSTSASSTSTSAPPGSTSSSSSSAGASVSSSGIPKGNGEGLSTGTKVGLGVGIVVGVLVLIGCAILFWRTRVLQKKLASQDQSASRSNPYDNLAYGGPTVDSSAWGGEKYMHQGAGAWGGKYAYTGVETAELDGGQGPAQLDATRSPIEAPTNAQAERWA